MAKLLREFNILTYDKKLVIENIENKQPIILKSILQRANIPNQNKRIYPRSVLEREVEKYKKVISENRAIAELDHPNESVVSLKNVSHMIKDIWWDGDEVWGTVEILDTPSGRIVKDLMKSSVMLGLSSRGIGDVIKEDTGFDRVTDDYNLVCFDIVSEPSTENAYLREAKELSISEYRNMICKSDRINKILNEILKGL